MLSPRARSEPHTGLRRMVVTDQLPITISMRAGIMVRGTRGRGVLDAIAASTHAPTLGRYSRRSPKIVPIGKGMLETMTYVAVLSASHTHATERRWNRRMAPTTNVTANASPTHACGSVIAVMTGICRYE